MIVRFYFSLCEISLANLLELVKEVGMVYLSHPGNNCNCYGDQEQKLKNKSSRVSVVPKDTKAKQVISRREKEKNGSEM